MQRKKGRPKKNVDIGVIVHMLKNKASIAAVARHIGIHRDTLYVNFRPTIEEGRACYRKAWRIIADKMLEERRVKEALKPKKRRYSPRFLYRGKW